MKAAMYVGNGAELSVEDLVPEVALGPYEARVDLGATGVCHSDLTATEGVFGVLANPCILGHEGAGTVVEVGPMVTGVRVGDTVISSFIPACGHCFFCFRGQSHLCELRQREYPGTDTRAVRADGAPVRAFAALGTFAEQMIAHEAMLVPVQTDLPFEQLALIGCGVTTGVGAVFNIARVEPGTTVAVIGCGGVGLSAVQGAHIAGAGRIFAVDPVPFKRESALKLGATDGVDPTEADLVDQLRSVTEGRGVDYVFEVVGTPKTVQQAHAATRLGGTTVLIGAASPTTEVTLSMWDLHRDKRVLGCGFGNAQVRRDFPRLVSLAEAGKLDLAAMVSRRYPLSDVNEAFRAMMAGEVIRSVMV